MVDPGHSRRDFLKTSTTIVASAAVAQHSSAQALVGGGDEILNFHPKMGYRKLGKTGHMISEISLGGHGGSCVEDRVAVLNKAVELGINIPEQLEQNVKGSYERDHPRTAAHDEILEQCRQNYLAHLTPGYQWLRAWETV